MRNTAFVMSLAIAAPAMAQQAPAQVDSRIYDIVAAVSADRIEAGITALVGFGTRHTLSDTLSDTRGIGAARRWITAEFDQISAECGGCLEVFYVEEMYGPTRRIPDPVNVVSVVAIQRGTTDPNRMVIMSGDIDNIISRGAGSLPTDSNPGDIELFARGHVTRPPETMSWHNGHHHCRGRIPDKIPTTYSRTMPVGVSFVFLHNAIPFI